MGRNFFPGRRDRGTPGVERGFEYSFFQFLIALANFLLLVGQQLFQILGVFLDSVGEVYKIQGKDFGVGQAHDRCADGLREGAAVDEIVIGKMRVPVKVIVDGVINALLVFAGIAQVERGNAEMIEERGEVGAGTEGIDAEIGALAQFFAIVGRLRFGDLR